MLIFTIVTIIVVVVISCVGYYFANGLGAIGGLIVALIVSGAFYWYSFGTEEILTFKVEKAERMPNGESDKWIVVSSSGETFENTDAWLHGKTNSTDLQTDIEIGNTLTCKVNGLRITLLSSYRNLLKCHDDTAGEWLR